MTKNTKKFTKKNAKKPKAKTKFTLTSHFFRYNVAIFKFKDKFR